MSRPSGLALLLLSMEPNHGFTPATLRPEPGTSHRTDPRAKRRLPLFLHTWYSLTDPLDPRLFLPYQEENGGVERTRGHGKGHKVANETESSLKVSGRNAPANAAGG